MLAFVYVMSISMKIIDRIQLILKHDCIKTLSHTLRVLYWTSVGSGMNYDQTVTLYYDLRLQQSFQSDRIPVDKEQSLDDGVYTRFFRA